VARERERRVLSLVVAALGAKVLPTPAWLIRPGKVECSSQWPLIQELYQQLSPGLDLPDVMRPVERRELDAVLEHDGVVRAFEFDEKQRFNHFRADTLRRYAETVPLAFDAEEWIARSQQKERLEGGGFGKPKPPLFDGEHGRHRQRAFRDALADILPLVHGYAPTLRISEYEVASWLHGEDAAAQIEALLAAKLGRSS
jgi:hypothetical protein